MPPNRRSRRTLLGTHQRIRRRPNRRRPRTHHQIRLHAPFLATNKGIPLQHDPRLTTTQITTIEDWAKAGAQLDTPKTTPIKAPDDVALHPRADKTLTAEAPYQGSTSKTNDYRCPGHGPQVTKPTVVTGYEFVPDKNEFVHHALVYRMSADRRKGIDERDAATPAPATSASAAWAQAAVD